MASWREDGKTRRDMISLYVKFSDLERCDPEFARELLESPEKMLGSAIAAVVREKSVIIFSNIN
jgi:hypothetical protein